MSFHIFNLNQAWPDVGDFMKKKNSGVFFIVLILSVLIIVMAVVLIAKKDMKEVQNTNQQIKNAEAQAEDLEQGVKIINDAEQDRFDAVDSELDQITY